MTEKAARKLGEVYAFSQTMLQLLEKAHNASIEIWQEIGVENLKETHKSVIETLESISNTANVKDIMVPKAEKTVEKLNTMRDMYIKDEWENPTEILEWLGFFAGAAIVHWALVAGVSDSGKNTELLSLTEKTMKNWQDLFTQVKEKLYSVGKKI